MNAGAGARIILCADDYAIDLGVSAAMLDLIDAGRLNAVSAMASCPLWAGSAGKLAERRGAASIGLHLDLTHRPFDGERPPYPLRDLIVAALTGRLDLPAIAAEFARQLALFERAFGFPPDHVDGHHHVHALPGVREALFRALSERFRDAPPTSRPWLRNPADNWRAIAVRPGARSKALTVAFLSAGFGLRAQREGFSTNHGFGGFSRFQAGTTYAREFRYFACAPGRLHLVMCHPGRFDAGSGGEIDAARAAEYAYLSSDPDLTARLYRVRRDALDALLFQA